MATKNTKQCIKKEVNCKNCNSIFITTEYLLSINKGKFCSRICCDIYKIGKISPQKGSRDIEKNCLYCKNSFISIVSRIKAGYGKYCSKNCAIKNQKGKPSNALGKHWILPKQARENISNAHKGVKNWKWIEDRTQLKKYEGSESKRSPRYKDWRRNVCKRDNWSCRIADNSCEGRLEVHHILGWTEYPELRYNINNGITLCHAHHPKKRSEEKRLIPTFMELVSVSN